MLTPNDSSSFENQLSPRQDLTFNSLQALFDQQGLPFSPPASQFGILQFSNFDLLVSDQCPYTIKCAVFKGTDQDEFLDRQEFTGSLAAQFQQVYAFLEKHNPVESQIKGLYREDRPAYPKQALREALMNAIIHRDYSNLVTQFGHVSRVFLAFLKHRQPLHGREFKIVLISEVLGNKLQQHFVVRLVSVRSVKS